jgi:valyl-tRNA synthetase
MDWDWVISRQRIFATPIPAWYCSKCGNPVVAEESQLPLDPATSKPLVGQCPVCGGNDFKPERDVLDTWMDSSITIAAHAGWPEIDRRLFPADLQPNGTDIIRTWDYYLMIRHLALLGEAPYRTVMINGMVFGEDGRKMSKSLGNYVDTSSARGKYGADALRQWAAIGASTGSDVPFNWKDVEFGYRFMRKLWNATRFAAPYLKGAKDLDPDQLNFRPTDRWILSRLNRLVKDVTKWLEDFQFNHALGAIHTFVWHEFCDMYLEEVKHRLYAENPTEDAARWVLYRVTLTVIKLLAPFIPHFSEEVYQAHFAEEHTSPSVHVIDWPSTDERFIDKQSEKLGGLANSIISSIRQYKSEHGMPLNRAISKVNAYVLNKELAEALTEVVADVKGTTQVKQLEIKLGEPEAVQQFIEVEPDLAKLGPKLRSDLKVVVETLMKSDPGVITRELGERGCVIVSVGHKQFTLSKDEIKIKRGVAKGRGVVSIPELSITLIIKER